MQKLEIHPACETMPKMQPHEFDALKQSMAAGWDSKKEPILLFEGKILDGRHRYLACLEVGVEPVFADWSGENPYRFVWQQHSARRHWLSNDQKTICYKRSEAGALEWDRLHNKIQQEANQARSEAAKGNQNARKDKPAENSGGTVSATTVSKPKEHKARAAKAAAAGTDRGSVQRAEKIERLAEELGKPELVDKVANGEVKAFAALKSLEEEKRKQDLQRPVEIETDDRLRVGDFYELSLEIPDNSVELVFTDPPYDGDSVILYERAAEVAARILKPGGSFIAYSGQRYLPDVYAACAKHLRYWWTVAGVHAGGNQMLQKLGIRCGWKPLVWYVKGTRGDVQNVLLDVVTGDREKSHHEWQQAESEAAYFIERLCSPAGVVVDFFVGGGTTLVAAEKLGRKCVGYELMPSRAESAARRMAGGR